MIGTSIGRYEVQEELGQGGMSVVYRGLDKSLEREVAIKVLHSHLAKKSENRQRLHREAKAIARLKHPNILEIYDYGAEEEERAYIVMEYVPGRNLKQFLQEHGPLPAEHCALIGLQLCQALSQAHNHGIIHRDLKPENIMVSARGQLKLMDFGIAHVFDAETMTQTGSLLGSPAHMAPEMIEGDEIDARADIFALGTVLYLLATGELPFDGKNAPQILKRVLEGLYKNPESVNPKVGSQLGDVIRRCMAYQVEDRYPDVTQVAAALTQFLESAQLEDPKQCLERYLLNPTQERERFEQAIVPRLLKQASAAIEADHPQEAFSYLNRVLGYDPQNPKVLAQLEQLQRRSLKRPIMIAAATIAIVGVSSAGVYAAIHAKDKAQLKTQPETTAARLAPIAQPALDRQREAALEAAEQALMSAQQVSLLAQATHTQETDKLAAEIAQLMTQESLKQASARAQAKAPTARAPILTAREAQGSGQSTRPKDATAQGGQLTQDPGANDAKPTTQTPPKAKWTYRFKVLPPTASLFIAGEQKSALEVMTQGVELERGTHVMRLSAPGCLQYTQTFSVDGPPSAEGPIPLVMTWRSGVVQIKSDVPSTIFIDGASHGTVQPGLMRTIQFPFGKADEAKPEKNLRVVLYSSKDMTRNYIKEVRLRPGSTQLIQGTFSP